MKRRNRGTLWHILWVLPLTALIVAGAYYLSGGAPTQASGTPTPDPVQTATVRRGELVVSAVGAGSVIAEKSVPLAFASGGLLVEVPVKVGDKVAAGALLARLDDTAARAKVADANRALRQAQLQLEQLKSPPTASELAQARASLASAQSTLQLRTEPAGTQELAAARQNLLSAQKKLASLLAGPSNEDRVSAEADLRLATISLQEAQGAYDKVSWRGDVGASQQAKALQEATLAFDKAKATYDTKMKGATEAEIAAGRAAVAQAQSQLDELNAGVTAPELTAAEAAVEQAQAQLDSLLAGPSGVEIELSEINVSQAESNLAEARLALEETKLIATFDGTVTAVGAAEGERVGGSTLVTLADLDQPLVQVYLDESDLDKVGLNYEAEVTFDALPDQVFTGHVTQVDPELTNSNGVTAIRAVIRLDEDSFAKPQSLPVGLNASVEVIGGRATNALLVPVEALREVSSGKYALFVMVSGQPELRFVEVGLMDYTYAEVVSGVEEGDVVTTGLVETGGSGGSSTAQDRQAQSSTTGQQGAGPPPDMMIMGGP
jgi:HlyD family secretion protein